MTNERRREPIFIPDRIGTDIMMSLSGFFTLLSLSIFLLCYAHIFRVSYSILLVCAILPLTFVMIRRLKFSFVSLLLLHLAFSLTFVVIMQRIMGGTNQATYNAAFLGVTVAIPNIIYSMIQRLSYGKRRVRSDGFLFALIMHFLLAIVLILTGYHFRLDMVTTNLMLLLICFLTARQTDTFEERYYHNLHSSTQPISSVKRQNTIMTLIGVGGILLAFILLQFIPIGKLSRMIARLFNKLPYLLNLKLEEEPASSEAEELTRMPDFPKEDDSGSPIVMKIITVITIVIIAFIVTVLIYNLVRAIVSRFHKMERKEKVVENDAVVDIIEDVSPKKSKTKARHLDFGEGYEREIRKKYFARVTKAIHHGLPIKASSSPKQIEALIKEEGDPSISELTSLYESVRYNKKTN